MTWDSYITNLKGDGRSIKEAAIWGFAEGSQSAWAHSPGLSAITAEEISKLSGDLSKAFTEGLYLAGKKCKLLRDLRDKDSWGLLLSMPNDDQVNTVCVCKSNTAYVIALCQPSAKGGQALPAVHDMAEYLKKSNY